MKAKTNYVDVSGEPEVGLSFQIVNYSEEMTIIVINNEC